MTTVTARITVRCEMVPGPLAATVAERLLSIVVDELCQIPVFYWSHRRDATAARTVEGRAEA